MTLDKRTMTMIRERDTVVRNEDREWGRDQSLKEQYLELYYILRIKRVKQVSKNIWFMCMYVSMFLNITVAIMWRSAYLELNIIKLMLLHCTLF